MSADLFFTIVEGGCLVLASFSLWRLAVCEKRRRELEFDFGVVCGAMAVELKPRLVVDAGELLPAAKWVRHCLEIKDPSLLEKLKDES